MNIALFSAKTYDRAIFEEHGIPRGHKIVSFSAALNRQTTNLAQGFDAVCVFVNDKLDAPTLKKLGSLGIRLIALRCAGFNNVDIEAAQREGMTVVRVPAYSPQAVAEHALALMLTLNRKTHKAYNRVREGNFSLERMMGFTISGRTVGVIGTGLIGKAFSRIMMGFGCRVLAFDPYPSKEIEKEGVKYASLKELLGKSDIISLHCPLNPDTHHLIRKETLAFMKEGAMLLNTSRGGLIHTLDAIHALKHGKLGSLGIDVYEQEEKLFFRDLSESIIQDDVIMRLMSFPNVLITAHQGFFTHEAVHEIVETTLDNIEAFERGESSGNEVRPQGD